MEKRDDPSPEGAGMRAGPAHTRRIPHTLPSRQILQNSMVKPPARPWVPPEESLRGECPVPGTADPVGDRLLDKIQNASDPCLSWIGGGNPSSAITWSAYDR